MSTIVLASASGAPGTTVTALGLTLVWPRDVLLVDADRSASQSLLAGYLRGAAPPGDGLQAVLRAYRERGDLAAAVLSQRMALPEPPSDRPAPAAPIHRDFLPGFAHLGSIDLFEGAWRPLGALFRQAPFDVVVDAGRVGHRGLPLELASAADVLGLVCRTSLVSLAGVRLHLPPLVDAAPPGRCGLVLVGPGRPYAASEVAEQFGVPVLAHVAWDPSGAGELASGEGQGRRWFRTPLARSYADAAAALRTWADADTLAAVAR